MMYRYKFLLLIGCVLCFAPLLANNTITDSEKEGRPKVMAIENNLEGQLLGGSLLLVYFNLTQEEFNDYVSVNSIQSIKVDLVKTTKSNNAATIVGSETINTTTSFNVNAWSLSLENADTTNNSYFTQVTLNDGACGPQLPLSIVEEEVQEEETDNPIDLPEFTCGETFIPESISNVDPLEEAFVGDVFNISGFPILVQELSGSAGTYSGIGVVPLPFNSGLVRVSFDNVAVNTDYKIYSGTVSGISDAPENYPDFNLDSDPLNIGGDICLPPPPPEGYNEEGVNDVTGLDDWGFDPETGLNNSTGTEYDENGYDINGNHVGTSTPYNEEGCNRDGFTEDGMPCDPSGGPNPEAEAYAEQVTPTLPQTLADLIAQLTADMEGQVTALDCAGVRTELEGLITTLGFEREFIFGENDQYINAAMHLAFTNEPRPMTLNLEGRDPNVIALEQKHIDLYHCDREEYKLNLLLQALQNLDVASFAPQILAAIANWTAYEYSLYTATEEDFNNWLLRQIGTQIQEDSGLGDEYFGYHENNPIETRYGLATRQLESIFNLDMSNSPYFATASLENGLTMFDSKDALKAASFEFQQGAQYIGGIDRAFFLEALTNYQINTEEENLLPIPVSKTVGNKTYTIYLDAISFTPTGAILDAYIIIDDPETGRRLVLRALNISFGPTGLEEESRLLLDTDIEVRLSNSAMLVLKGTPDTYVAWDCNGFSSMGIDAEIEFCRDFITPLDPNTLEPLPDPERYRISVQLQDISAWLEFYLVVDAPPFAITGHEDIKWEVSNMILDFSSSNTPTFTPLEGYDSPYWDGTQMSPMWKGFYMENLIVTLPDDFSRGDDPIVINAFDILIDGTGFSGGIEVENLIPIDEGAIANWPFSIETLEIHILKNRLAGGGMGGQVKVPLFEENMAYEATIFPNNNYSFVVSPTDELTSNTFLGTVVLEESSNISIGKENGEFKAIATLNGKLVIGGSNEEGASANLQLPEVTFQEFQISNRSPYFSPGTWGLGDTLLAADFNGFSIALENVMPYSSGEGRVGLGFEVAVILTEGLDIGARGGFGLEAVLVEEEGRQRWVYDRFDIRQFSIAASFPGAEVAGLLEWYGDDESPDPVWGKGFRGILSAEFSGLGGVGLQAIAQFGKKDDYKYFFVDALANLGGAGISTGLLQIRGFGGGVSYHMDSSPGDVVNLFSGGNPTPPPLGTSISGRVYTPDGNVGLGLKASAILSTLQENIFNGTVSLSFQFNTDNGLEEIAITGSGHFLQDLNPGIPASGLPTGGASGPPSGVDAALSAYIDLNFNFSTPSFDGTLYAYLNTPFAVGIGEGGKLVDAQLHFGPEEWYIYIGKPGEGERCGLVFNVPGLGDVEATAYFDIGTNVPSMPPLPQTVQEIAYLVNTNESLRQSGAGLVFGAALEISMEASIAGIVSASLNGGAGFDIMLRKYEGLSCQGSDGPVGIDGWYASGQMWAYITGSISVFGVEIINAGIAAVLQARLPNPFFAQATVGVRVKLLFVTVEKSLQLQLGNDCILVSDDPSNEVGMQVITFLQPLEGGTDIETHAQPEASFALELEKNYNITDLNGVEQQYRVKFPLTTLTDSQGNEISHTIEYINNRTACHIIPRVAMPGNETMTFTVNVDIHKNGEYLATETKSTVFTTGESIDYIPEENVQAAYPADGMANFYKEEYNYHEGFIKLITGQPQLLYQAPEGFEQVIRLTSASGEVQYIDYIYNTAAREVRFPLDPSQLENETLYKLELIRTQSFETSGTGSASTGSSYDSAFGDAAPTVPQSPQTAVGIVPDHVMYTVYFRTSQYNTFRDKIIDINTNDPDFNKQLMDFEPFDYLEMGRGTKFERTVTFDIDINKSWVNNHILDELEDMDIFLCDDNIQGFEPEALLETAIIFRNNLDDGIITKDHYLSGGFDYRAPNAMRFTLEGAGNEVIDLAQDVMQACYDAPTFYVYESDCAELGEDSPGCQALSAYYDLLDYSPPSISSGVYTATVTYTLPGTNITTTSYNMQFEK